VLFGPKSSKYKAVNEAGNGRAYIAKSSSKSSESNSTLYHISSLSLVNLSERSLSDESGGEESSN